MDDVMTPKVWQLAMKRIYNQYNKAIVATLGEDYTYCFADTAVCNTARIMRLPGSINQKH